MRILVTNDDGIDSPGIWALAEAMNRVGEVLVVAPDKEQSGVGTAMSFHHGLKMTEVEPRVAGVSAFAVNGTPTDCAVLGLQKWSEGGVDLIVSGINTGANIGSGLLGSGTVMPTRIGAGRGMPSFAVSLSRNGPHDLREMIFDFAASVAERLALAVRDGEVPPDITLNVNVPSVPVGETRRMAVTTVSAVGYWQVRSLTGDDGLKRHRLTPVPVDDPRIEDGSDIWAINQGWVSISPLRYEVTDHPAIPALTDCIGRLAPTP